jgi:hypothetical protein
VVVISGYPVSIGKLVIVASWLRERSSVIELLSSALVAVASDGSDGTTTEETSSDASPDVVLLSKGSVSTSEVASGMRSDEVGTSDWMSELIASGRSVGCVRTLVGVTKPESMTTELVLAAPSRSLMLVSIASDAVTTAEVRSDTTLEGRSVTAGRSETSRVSSDVISAEIEVSVGASAIGVIDGELTASARTLEDTPVSIDKELVLGPSRSIPELLVLDKSDTIVSEASSWDIALNEASVPEGSVGASVMIWEVAVCASTSDVIDGSRLVVSTVAESERSDSIAELSTTAKLVEGRSCVAELIAVSPSPVAGSGALVIDVSRSEMVLDGESVRTGMNPVAEPRYESVEEGFARTLVATLEFRSDGTEVWDPRSTLDVIDGRSVVSARTLDSTDSGSMVELSTTVGSKEELSSMTEPVSIELVSGTSGAVVIDGRISTLVIDGRSVVGADVGVASMIVSVLGMVEAEISDMISELIVGVGNPVVSSTTLVGTGSRLIAELSATDATIEEVSCTMELESRLLVSGVSDTAVIWLRISRVVLDGRSVIDGNIEVMSSVTSVLISVGV